MVVVAAVAVVVVEVQLLVPPAVERWPSPVARRLTGMASEGEPPLSAGRARRRDDLGGLPATSRGRNTHVRVRTTM